MPYAIKQDLIDRYGNAELVELTDRAQPALGVIDDAVLNKALTDADAEINGYIAVKYALPLATTPDNVKRMACDMARYYLYEDRVTDQVRQRYEDAVAILKRIASGQASLGLDTANVIVPTTGGAQTKTVDRVFTRDALADYV